MIDFTKCRPVVEPANLLGMQSVSFEDFLQKDIPAQARKKEGLQAIFKDVFPVKSHKEKLVLDFVEYRFDEPKYSLEKCRQEEFTYSLPLYAKFRLINKEIGQVKEEEAYLADFPLMTEEETFIINGAERIIIGQLQRSPGLFLEEDTSTASGAPISYRAPFPVSYEDPRARFGGRRLRELVCSSYFLHFFFAHNCLQLSKRKDLLLNPLTSEVQEEFSQQYNISTSSV